MKIKMLVATILATFALSGTGHAQQVPSQLTIVTGVSGGSWYAIGAGIADLFSKNGARANAEPGGAASNIIAVLNDQAQVGMTMSILPELAEKGEAPFSEPVTGVSAIAVMFPNLLHVMVRSDTDITSPEGLAGEPFASQAIGTGTQIAFNDFLGAAGLSEADLEVTRGGQSHGTALMRDRQVAGITAVTAVPSGTLTELAASQDITFLPVTSEIFAAMKAANSGYVMSEIPAKAYPNLQEAVPTVSTDTMMVVANDMSDDEAYWIAKTLTENIKVLNGMHSSMKDLTIESLPKVSGLPLHPGARRYYEEAGLL